MGLFDKFKKEKEEKKQEEAINTAGWDAISAECDRIYDSKMHVDHFRPVVPFMLGGNDPLEGIDVYDAGDYWHFVTYGLSELYEKECENKDISGYGMEFTFKLKKEDYEDKDGEIRCICGILQALARITFKNGEIFQPYEYVYTGQTTGIDVKQKSNLTGFITVPDDKFHTIKTPNGEVQFVEFIGATDAELLQLKDHGMSVKDLFEQLESDVTNYHRSSLY